MSRRPRPTAGEAAALCISGGGDPNCVSQAGEIREYRDADGRVLAFAHEATKGRVMRGQWFYATDAAAKDYVWFHSVRSLQPYVPKLQQYLTSL